MDCLGQHFLAGQKTRLALTVSWQVGRGVPATAAPVPLKTTAGLPPWCVSLGIGDTLQ